MVPLGSLQVMAEREGFEPSVPSKGHNGFRDRPDRPLRHLSARLHCREAEARSRQVEKAAEPNLSAALPQPREQGAQPTPRVRGYRR